MNTHALWFFASDVHTGERNTAGTQGADRGTEVAQPPDMTQLRFLALSFTAIGALAITGCVDDSKLRVRNDSDFAIVDIRVAERGDRWSESVLGGDILQPGESLTIRLDCGTYDAQLVDETNTTCEIHDIDLCFSRADWIIRNNTCSFRPSRAAEAKQPEAAGSNDPAK